MSEPVFILCADRLPVLVSVVVYGRRRHFIRRLIPQDGQCASNEWLRSFTALLPTLREALHPTKAH